MIIAFTGHRPERLGGEPEVSATANRVVALLEEAIDRALTRYPEAHFLSGGARGVDQWAAALVLDRHAALTIARPFPTQDARWPAVAQRVYAELQQRCLTTGGEVVDTSPTPFIGAYGRRDRWMVDQANVVIAVWDGGPGGTSRCGAYAHRLYRPLLRIDPRDFSMTWERPIPPDNVTQRHLPLQDDS